MGYDPEQRPGTGMQTATKNNTDSWTLEIRFPIYSTDDHGGLINLHPGAYYPGTDPTLLHPEKGQRFWATTFANALHAPWWSKLNATTTKEPQMIKSLCEKVIDADIKANGGFTQFLLDANNAAPTCYYEAASQNLGGHQYMHNPDYFGYFQFTEHDSKSCKNVQWLGRFVLAQLYQAQVQFLTGPQWGNGSYSASLSKLMSESVCTIDNGCNSTALSLVASRVKITVTAEEGKKSGNCPRYAVGTWQTSDWTGGPCFTVSVAYSIRSKRDPSKTIQIHGVVNEARLIKFTPDVGQKWNEPDSDWLCLDDVVLGDDLVYI